MNYREMRENFDINERSYASTQRIETQLGDNKVNVPEDLYESYNTMREEFGSCVSLLHACLIYNIVLNENVIKVLAVLCDTTLPNIMELMKIGQTLNTWSSSYRGKMHSITDVVRGVKYQLRKNVEKYLNNREEKLCEHITELKEIAKSL